MNRVQRGLIGAVIGLFVGVGVVIFELAGFNPDKSSYLGTIAILIAFFAFSFGITTENTDFDGNSKMSRPVRGFIGAIFGLFLGIGMHVFGLDFNYSSGYEVTIVMVIFCAIIGAIGMNDD